MAPGRASAIESGISLSTLCPKRKEPTNIVTSVSMFGNKAVNELDDDDSPKYDDQ